MGRKWPGLSTLLLLLAAACGPGEPPGPPPPEAPPVPEASVSETSAVPSSEPAPGVAAESALAPGSGAFPHGEHRGVQCAICHSSLPSHTTHGDVECTACHGVPEGYGMVPVRSAEDCLACHHDPERAMDCRTCHGSEGGGQVSVQVAFNLVEGSSPTARSLVFPHDRHGTWSCTTCHTEGVRYGVSRDCASCHSLHHRPESDCAACHRPAVERHTLEAHLGCNASGCHGQVDLTSLAEGRTMCLICHPGRRLHEPGPPCAQCHAIVPSATALIESPRPMGIEKHDLRGAA
jgi:hypothetical protein